MDSGEPTAAPRTRDAAAIDWRLKATIAKCSLRDGARSYLEGKSLTFTATDIVIGAL